MRIASLSLAVMIPVVLTACATVLAVHVPDVPAALHPPADQVAYLEARATGVQIYECSQKSDGSFEWAFKAPEAALATPAGQPIGKHYAGPTWEASDGSKIVGEVKAKDAGPTPTAIPWLLLAAKSNSGNGVFGNARSVQRILTNGGVAPSAACDASALHQVARVPYTATYFFYR